MKEFVVNREALEKALEDAKTTKQCRSRNALFTLTANLYNATKPPKRLTAAVVRLRVEAWGLDAGIEARKKLSAEERAEAGEVEEVARVSAEKNFPPMPVARPKLTPAEHASRIIRLGPDRARTLLEQARRGRRGESKTKMWSHVDWDLVEESLDE